MNFKNFTKLWQVLLLAPFLFMMACEEDAVEPAEDAIASFQFEVDANDWKTVNFTNFSQNAVSQSWDFGDGGTSTAESPSYTYSEAGDYTVALTATNADGVSATKSELVTITDPDLALKRITGEVSKTWKLFREGTSMQLGPDATNPGGWWPGLTNDGSRPCLYNQTVTFGLDGSYVFDDGGMFWGEFGVFDGTDRHEVCFDPTAANMINKNGVDVSAWGSGTHAFTYDASLGTVTLSGMGAWIGIPKLTTTGEDPQPVNGITFNVSIVEETGYDVMTVTFNYGDGGLWTIVYVSYSDTTLEPDVVTEAAGFGSDLDDISPSALSRTFASADAADFVLLDTITSNSTIVYGVDDPADAAAAKVGQFNRTGEQFQELQFQTSPTKNDINFANLTTVTLDVYIPSTNDYTTLTKGVIIGVADKSATEQWWTDNREWVNDGTAIATDQWVTLTYNLDTPTAGAGTYTPYDRNDLDMIYIQIGGGNHTATGTFYIRNLSFQ